MPDRVVEYFQSLIRAGIGLDRADLGVFGRFGVSAIVCHGRERLATKTAGELASSAQLLIQIGICNLVPI